MCRSMSGKEEPAGWGLSSEQYDEDKVLEVDTRSIDYEELRKDAKDPHATWSDDTEEDREGDEAEVQDTDQPDAEGDGGAG